MRLSRVMPVILLMLGLVVGFGAGAAQRSATVTEVLTMTQPVTVTSVATTRELITLRETATQTFRETILVTVTRTITGTVAMTIVETVTATTTVYPAERGTILVTDRGSGDKETRPFTLNATSDLKITIKIRARADLRYVALSWYLYNVELERWIKNGEVNGEEGEFEFYVARVPPGNWYVKIIAANCNWEIIVEKVT